MRSVAGLTCVDSGGGLDTRVLKIFLMVDVLFIGKYRCEFYGGMNG